MTELPIETLKDGRYRIESVLGAGGMSVVFKAFDNRIGVHRAIKLLHPKFAQNARIRERFENEAYAQAGLRHPNILMVHDVVEEDIGVYLVMEMAERGSLSGRVKNLGPLSPQETAQVGMAMASALSVAHAEGVIHRDIKPENILVDRLGNLKLADFGIARVVARDHDLTRTGTVMGTWAYMPPEQRDSAKYVDARSDIYALGASLYFLATGRQPFDLHNAEAHAQAFADFPPALASVIQRTTRFSPDDRHADCEELRTDLAAIVDALASEPFVDFDPPTNPPETQVPELGDLSTYIIAARAAARGATAVPGGTAIPGGTAVPGNTAIPGASGGSGGASTFVFDGPEDDAAQPPQPQIDDRPAAPGPTIVAEPEDLPATAQPSSTSGISGSQLMIFVAGILAAVLAVVVLLPGLLKPQPSEPAVDASLGTMAATEPTALPVAEPPPPEEAQDGGAGSELPPPQEASAQPASATTAPAATPPASPATGSASEPRVITIQPLPSTGSTTAAQPDDLGGQLVEPTGTVVVKTVPSGATVRLNGAVLSRSGAGYSLPVGNHLLEIESTTGEVHRAPVSVSRGGQVEICYSFDTNSACSSP